MIKLKLYKGVKMFTENDIKDIPKYIINKIKIRDKNAYGSVRFYSYLSKIKKELVRITVACKNYQKQWFCKQVAVHGVHSENCLVRDIDYSLLGFSVGWRAQNMPQVKKIYDNNKWCSAKDKYYNPYAPIVNKKYALKFDIYKYSVVDKYPYNDILNYLRIYEQFPEAEYLMKMGLFHLATSKSILKKAQRDKNFRKWISQNAKSLKNEFGNLPYFSTKTMLFSYKNNLSVIDGNKLFESIKELENDYTFKQQLSDLIKKEEYINFINYIDKQNTNVNSYADYVTACKYLHLDLSLPKNKYPHDFKRWHDIRIDEYHTAQIIDDKKKRKTLYKQFLNIANKYASLQRNLNDDYAVIIAKSPAELIHEGNRLDHCVGRMNYDQKFIREESLIFFIRNKNELDKPFVTVEYSLDKHKILQCYGYRDSKPKDEVLEFVNKKWLPYANKKLKKLVA